MQRMAELSVPALGTACLVCLLADDRGVTGVAERHLNPQGQVQSTDFRSLAIGDGPAWEHVLNVAQSRQAAVLSQVTTADMLGDTGSPSLILSELGLKTALLVPVVDRERQRTQAVAVFLSARPRQYGVRQLDLAEDLVSRFSLALEAALMYRACQGVIEDNQETLATTVHDLMSPLTYIKGTARQMRRFEHGIADPQTRSELRTRLEAIDAATNRIASALTDLLQTTHPRHKQSTRVSRRTVDLVDLVRRSVAEHQLLARHHTLHLNRTQATLTGAWDAGRIERMLGNLLNNAIKYSPPGSTVQVSLACEEDADGRWTVLRVADQGVGIPAPDLPFVFEPYRRGSNVAAMTGTGLGLASVWQTVKMHDGHVSVQSDEGHGTTVTVRLPYVVLSARGPDQPGMR
jgi:signal transduction histidine kinase